MFAEFLKDYQDGLVETMKKIDAVRFQKIIEMLREAYKNERQVFIVGNGGSAGTANHFVCDFGKNAVQGEGKRRFHIISLSDNIEKITALGNDIAFEEIYRQQLINLMNDEDVLIVVSASGSSPNLVRACEYAQSKKAHIVALAGFDGGKIKAFAEEALIVPLICYEQIEDLHLVILHMIVYFFKNHPEYLAG